MRIHLITHYFPPEIGAPQARLSEMAREWVKQGHQVTVFTGLPNHPTGIIPTEYRGKLFMKEERDGYEIYRHWLFATPNKGLIKKTLGHLSLMASISLMSTFRGQRPDVVIVSSPTFFSVGSAWVMARARRAPYVFEVRDLWPDIFIELGVLKNKGVIAVLKWLETFFYAQADAIVPVTHGFKEAIAAQGIASEKVHVVTNGVDLEFFSAADNLRDLRSEFNIGRDRFVVLYIGAHGISHGLPAIIDVAKECDERVLFWFVGEGAVKQELEERVRELGLSNVKFSPGQPREAVPSFYRAADACLVPLKDIKGFQTFIPSKMFEIMACERPIIGAVDGEAREILERSGSAILVQPENRDQIKQAIDRLMGSTELREELGRRGKKFVHEHYDRREQASAYLKILERLR